VVLGIWPEGLRPHSVESDTACARKPHMNLGESLNQSQACFIMVTGKRDPERLVARQHAQRKEARDF
jgi:hypothetical protein